MKKQRKSSREKVLENKIIEIEKNRKKDLRALSKKMLNEKVSYTINFFKDQGKMITRDEAISIIKHMESLPAYKQYKSEIQPLIIKEVSLEKELESLQSAIDEERTKLLDIEKEISKLNKS